MNLSFQKKNNIGKKKKVILKNQIIKVNVKCNRKENFMLKKMKYFYQTFSQKQQIHKTTLAKITKKIGKFLKVKRQALKR